MADDTSKTYTEEELFLLFQQWQNQQRQNNEAERTQKQIPLDIVNILEESSTNELKENFQKYKRQLNKYHHDEWTVGEEINEQFQYKIKKHMVSTQDVVKNVYEQAEETRIMARAAIELYQQLWYLQNAEQLSTPERNTLWYSHLSKI